VTGCNRLIGNAKGAYWIFLVTAAFGLIAYNIYLINFPFQMTTGESVAVLLTRRIAEGINPYLSQMMPTYANNYGVLYNLLLAPLVNIFGSSLVFFRIISALSMVAGAGILFLCLRKAGGSKQISLNIALVWWAQCLVLLHPTARVDAMGTFLYLAAISIPYLCNMSKRSFYGAAIIAVATFFIKQYFLLSGAMIAATSFFAIGIYFSILLSAAMITGVVFVLAFLDYIFPTYIENFIMVGSNYYVFSGDHLVEQIQHLGKENLFFLVTVLIILGVGLYRNMNALKNTQRPRFLLLSAPWLWGVIIPARARLWGLKGYHLIGVLVILPFAIVAQAGASSYYGVYIIQLLSPLFFILLVQFGIRKWSILLKATSIASLVWAVSALPVVERSGDKQLWGEWQKVIADKNNIYATPLLSILMDDLGKPIYIAGHAHTLQWAFQKTTLGNAWQTWYLKADIERRNNMLAQKQFDLVVLPAGIKKDMMLPEIAQNYTLIRSLQLPGAAQVPIRIGKFKKREQLYYLYIPK